MKTHVGKHPLSHYTQTNDGYFDSHLFSSSSSCLACHISTQGLHRPVAGRIALYAGCFLHPSTRMLSNLTCFSRLSVFILKLCHKTRPAQRLAVSDAYALTELIQWVWWSRVRRGEPITLYLPSPRMRRLFEEALLS